MQCNRSLKEEVKCYVTQMGSTACDISELQHFRICFSAENAKDR
jgi:hypothetical protein